MKTLFKWKLPTKRHSVKIQPGRGGRGLNIDGLSLKMKWECCLYWRTVGLII